MTTTPAPETERNRLEELRDVHDRYSMSGMTNGDVEWLISEIDRLRAELEWYADEHNYLLGDIDGNTFDVDTDMGDRARAALADGAAS